LEVWLVKVAGEGGWCNLPLALALLMLRSFYCRYNCRNLNKEDALATSFSVDANLLQTWSTARRSCRLLIRPPVENESRSLSTSITVVTVSLPKIRWAVEHSIEKQELWDRHLNSCNACLLLIRAGIEDTFTPYILSFLPSIQLIVLIEVAPNRTKELVLYVLHIRVARF